MDLDTDKDQPRRGRPRSEDARRAVIEAVDDLLVEVGYAAMSMRGIAERAGVGRQTVYRWWSTKAEVLLEACVTDAAKQLRTPANADPAKDLAGYLAALGRFLVTDPAGLAFLALVGEAQHDPVVRDLVAGADVLGPPTQAVLSRVRASMTSMPAARLAADQLVGPTLTRVLLEGKSLSSKETTLHVEGLVTAWRH